MRHFTSRPEPRLPSRKDGAWCKIQAITPLSSLTSEVGQRRFCTDKLYGYIFRCGTHHVPPRSQSGLCSFVMESSDAAQSMTSPPGASQVADAIQPVGRSSIPAHHVGNSYGSTVTIAATMVFQPTLPARGATMCQYSKRYGKRIISIHAPREGSDGVAGRRHQLSPISIHAPREGSDTWRMQSTPMDTISIHAPREGSDRRILLFHPRDGYFNPRSPRGERQT